MTGVYSGIPFLKAGALLALVFFSFLMLRISLQYVPYDPDVAFLRIKQDVVHHSWYLPAFYVHVWTSFFLLMAGFTQFSGKMRSKMPAVHRAMGRIYVTVLLLLAAPSGFVIGLVANGGIPSRLAFCLLATLWFLYTLMGLRAILGGDMTQHRAFFLRSFALTLSAITLRAWKWLFVFLLAPRPMDVYMVVAWLGWIPNLLAVELYLCYERGKRKQDV